MSDKPATEPAKLAAITDDGEHPFSMMEPMRISEGNSQYEVLNQLAFDLVGKANALRAGLPQRMVPALARLVRSMNCYYSNLIEGHNTHPIDIERALNDDYSSDPRKRDLQLEARAHIEVQSWIDAHLSDDGFFPALLSAKGIQEVHARFCTHLPTELLVVRTESGDEEIEVVPGVYRTRFVKVGQHIPVSPGAIERFMRRYEEAYAGLGKWALVLSAAAAHHRLLWIHPFIDGNGRVTRLLSHAILTHALDTGGIWSVSRGLARNEAAYKAHLQSCDHTRHGDRDGRGNLSEAALVDFTRFFLETSIDQVDFMQSLVQPKRLHEKVMQWARREVEAGNLPDRSSGLLEALLYRGEIARGEVADIVGASERTARRIVKSLIWLGIVQSETHKAPLHLALPAKLAGELMPGLFPEKTYV